jgi:hypothetical protein
MKKKVAEKLTTFSTGTIIINFVNIRGKCGRIWHTGYNRFFC